MYLEMKQMLMVFHFLYLQAMVLMEKVPPPLKIQLYSKRCPYVEVWQMLFLQPYQ